MSRFPVFTLALLTLAGAAQAQETPLEAADAPGGRILWIEPLGTVLGGVYSGAQSGEQLTMLSGGYAHPLDARRALTTELLVLHQSVRCWGTTGRCSGDTWVRASVGLAYSYGGGPGRGFLLQPRLILGYFHEEQGLSIQAGLDVGYQWRLGPVYLALVGGLAAGVSTVDASVEPFFTTDPGFTSVGGQALRPALGLNLQLLRLGFTF